MVVVVAAVRHPDANIDPCLSGRQRQEEQGQNREDETALAEHLGLLHFSIWTAITSQHVRRRMAGLRPAFAAPGNWSRHDRNSLSTRFKLPQWHRWDRPLSPDQFSEVENSAPPPSQAGIIL
jgi:hypothetical protein